MHLITQKHTHAQETPRRTHSTGTKDFGAINPPATNNLTIWQSDNLTIWHHSLERKVAFQSSNHLKWIHIWSWIYKILICWNPWWKEQKYWMDNVTVTKPKSQKLAIEGVGCLLCSDHFWKVFYGEMYTHSPLKNDHVKIWEQPKPKSLIDQSAAHIFRGHWV